MSFVVGMGEIVALRAGCTRGGEGYRSRAAGMSSAGPTVE
jgi:hypothetical protein